jgi:hypothetical protein
LLLDRGVGRGGAGLLERQHRVGGISRREHGQSEGDDRDPEQDADQAEQAP